MREGKIGLIALLGAKVYVLVTDRQGAANSGTIWSWVSDNLHLLGGQRICSRCWTVPFLDGNPASTVDRD